MFFSRLKFPQLAVCLLLACGGGLHAQVKLPSVLAEHMVVQRGRPVHLWGTAAPGEHVTANFRGANAAATADKLGLWSILLPAGDAGGPFDMRIAGTNTIEFHDVLVGDVWLAGGQSNMEMPVGIKPPWKAGVTNYKQELASAHFPSIRLFQVEFQHSDFPQHDTRATTWTPATPESVNGFSAVAYFFGREVYGHEHIPIGLIESDIGATTLEAWTSLDALASDPANMGVFQNWANTTDAEYGKDRKDAVAAAAAASAPKANSDAPITAAEERRATIFNGPAQLWNAMIFPLTPFPVKGFLFYHGEANAHPIARARTYQHLFETLIADWRKQWAEADAPFLFVQVQNRENRQGAEVATVRDAQRRTLEVPATGMAVSIDVGDPQLYHPPNKQDVGHRLALWALAEVYHANVGEYSGPLFQAATPHGGEIVARFTHAAGMVAKGGTLTSFEVAGDDGVFVPATARIEGDTVVASAASVPQPKAVRYAWGGNPPAPLYNSANLPAATFTSAP